MCGIAGILLKQTGDFDLREKIVQMTESIHHRGPDGEGYLLGTAGSLKPYYHAVKPPPSSGLPYSPGDLLTSAPSEGLLAFGHRRLNIIDLSEAGHQPMCNSQATHWINFNGEIYNYIELRDELQRTGYHFFSTCDTEVVLAAYITWGTACVERFNGMWSFCIYDPANNICFCSRDRLGVKPFYYVNNKKLFAFASEQKAFIKSGLVRPAINERSLADYLLNGQAESRAENFFDGVLELWPGHNLVYALSSGNVTPTPYYHLNEHVNLNNEALDDEALIKVIGNVFENAVRLRLRSDVEVGTCLSGGIDSSALAVTMAAHAKKPVNCFTSVFPGRPFDESRFARLVAHQIKGNAFTVEPTLPGFLNEVDDLVYSQDVPIWDTSTYAQYKVMELSSQHQIKVVLDGQGADELFGGYHHHFLAKWNNLVSRGKYIEVIRDIRHASKTIQHPLNFYIKESLKQAYNFNQRKTAHFFNDDLMRTGSDARPAYFNDLNKQLIDDIYHTRLKSFLKCEDRCGMWHSVESRTPFSDDIGLINLLFSFDANRKIKRGVSKHLLREAVKKKLPVEIYHRYDKKGFETPMQDWMKQMRPMVIDEIERSQFGFLNPGCLRQTHEDDAFQNKILFRLFVLGRWQRVFKV